MEMEFGQFFRKLESNVMVVRRRKQLLPQDGAEMSRSGEKTCDEDSIEELLIAGAVYVKASADLDPRGHMFLHESSTRSRRAA